MTPAPLHPFLLALIQHTPLPCVPGPEWDGLLEQAARHHLLGLWLEHGEAAAASPTAVRDRLKAEVARTTARNLVLAEELRAMLVRLREAEIRCVPLRGVALAGRLHRSVMARPAGDIDLLIPRTELGRCAVVLHDLGFVEMDRRPGFAQEFAYTLKFLKNRHGWVIVEPHWSLAYPPFLETVDMAAVWERIQPAPVLGVPSWSLSFADLVLHLCLHILHRGETVPLLWYAELHQVISTAGGQLRWEDLLKTARGQEPLLLAVFERLQALCGTSLPATPLERLRAGRGEARSQSWPRARMADLLTSDSQVDGLESFGQLLVLKGLRRKLRYARGLLFPTPTFLRLQAGLPNSASVVHLYAGRLAFLVRETLKGSWQVLVGARRNPAVSGGRGYLPRVPARASTSRSAPPPE